MLRNLQSKEGEVRRRPWVGVCFWACLSELSCAFGMLQVQRANGAHHLWHSWVKLYSENTHPWSLLAGCFLLLSLPRFPIWPLKSQGWFFLWFWAVVVSGVLTPSQRWWFFLASTFLPHPPRLKIQQGLFPGHSTEMWFPGAWTALIVRANVYGHRLCWANLTAESQKIGILTFPSV